MELVPIVITSLEIVAALAVITFIVSYIAYRIKLKNSPEEYVPGKDMKPRFATRRFNRLTYITREIVHASKPKDVHPKAIPEKPKPIEDQKSYVNREMVSNAKPLKPQVEAKPKRLEVVKNLATETPIERTGKNSQNVKAEMNSLDDDILNKYVDDENHPLFSLKTNKDDTKQ